MNPQRPQWWMHVIAASFIATFALIFYLLIWGPAQLTGIVATFADDAMVIRSLAADSEAAKGGLRAGDRVLSIDGRPMRSPRDWTAATGNWEAGRPHRWLVSRGEDRVSLDIVPLPASVQGRLAEGYVQYLSHALSGFLLGLLIAWKRPADPVARIGAWFLMTASIAFGFPQGWAAPWRELPAVAQLPLWIPQISRFVLEGIFLSFFVVFPRRLFTVRWPWFVLWVPVLATLPWRIAGFDAVIHPDQGASVPAWILQAGFARTIVYLLAGIIVLVVSYRRLLEPNEKRRVRVLMVGTAASATSAIVLVWFDSFYGRSLNLEGVLFLSVVVPFNTACFLSLAYAILRHRVLDISVIIRQGLQYALARGAVIGVVPALGGILVLDLALNSNEPLVAVFRARGWIYAVLGGFVFITYWQRKPWLEMIDRRFFRERYNAQRVLRDVVDEIREARSFERVSPRVVARIETALHAEFVSVMVHEPGEKAYRSLASVPSGQALPPLNAENKVIALMRLLGKPLEVLLADSGFGGRLAHEEIDSLRRARVDLLVPIATDPARTEALLALGVKRSEELYTREDQELLEAIAASLGLLLEQPAIVEAHTAATIEECPRCGMCYEPKSGSCAHDGAKLKPMRLPRTLAGRYRLERRLGRGGMGTVYEATDAALERRVAVKVIRDDLVGSAEAAQRFRREARAAASFSHPNVVTVHDYGVEANTHAFLVMELLEGATLRDELNQRKRLLPSRAVDIFRGVCAGVDAAHRRQLIHRDLKPENIFLVQGDSAGELVKVLDFGIAKFLPVHDDSAPTRVTAETQTGFLVGTLAYMSPEQLLGETADVSWDLWALAVVAYESLTGAMPFDAMSASDWRRAVMAGKFTPLNEHLTDPPPRLQAFFASSFATNRIQRPRSAAEFFQYLEQAADSEIRRFQPPS